MARFSDAAGLPAHEDDQELFETSSSVVDSEDEDQFSDGEGDEALDNRFIQQTVRRSDSDSIYDMSSMKAQLPVKKGLSKYYDGKSQSFACMSEVRCLEDLRKKEIPFRKMKPSKSSVTLDGGNLQDCHASGANSVATAKTPSGSSCANLMARKNGKNMLYRPPPIHVNKGGYHQ